MDRELEYADEYHELYMLGLLPGQESEDDKVSAKDLFQKLGYEYNEDYKECLFRYVNEKENPYVYIYFYKDKEIEVAADYSLPYKVFQAINKQVEELWGGNNEK